MTTRLAVLIVSIVAMLFSAMVGALVIGQCRADQVEPLLIAAARGLSKMGFDRLVLRPGQDECRSPAQGFAFEGTRRGHSTTGSICVRRIDASHYEAEVTIDADDDDQTDRS